MVRPECQGSDYQWFLDAFTFYVSRFTSFAHSGNGLPFVSGANQISAMPTR
jgi:hypothetical protein